MDPTELEFLAEDELVSMVPRVRMEEVHLLDSQVGPFQPNVPVDVPYWIALFLRQQQKCRIMPPNWLSVAQLTEFKEAENNDTGCTVPPHPHYAELATLLLQHASDDIPDREDIRTLIKDIWDARVGKFLASVNSFVVSGAVTARVSQLTPLELSTTRNLLTNSLDQLAVIRATKQQLESKVGLSQTGSSTLDT
ncbi:hypothetical protein Aperf_G00000023181 [Anoplocephala perfoliata]